MNYLSNNKSLRIRDIVSKLEKEGNSNIDLGVEYLKNFIEYYKSVSVQQEGNDNLNPLLNKYISKFLNPYAKDWFEDSGLVITDYEDHENYIAFKSRVYYFTELGYKMFYVLLEEH